MDGGGVVEEVRSFFLMPNRQCPARARSLPRPAAPLFLWVPALECKCLTLSPLVCPSKLGLGLGL